MFRSQLLVSISKPCMHTLNVQHSPEVSILTPFHRWGEPSSEPSTESSHTHRTATNTASFFPTQAASFLLRRSHSQKLRLEQKQNQLSLSSFRGNPGSSPAAAHGGVPGRRPCRSRAPICSLWTFSILGTFPQSLSQALGWMLLS